MLNETMSTTKRGRLILMIAAPIHGKTVLGKGIARTDFGIYFDVDMFREHWFPDWRQVADLPGHSHNFDIDFHFHTMAVAIMMQEVDSQLNQGKTVVVAGTWSQSQFRGPLLDYLAGRGKDHEFHAIRLVGKLSEDQVKERLAERASRNDQSPIQKYDLYEKAWQWQHDLFEGSTEEPWIKPDLEVDTTQLSFEESLDTVREFLKGKN